MELNTHHLFLWGRFEKMAASRWPMQPSPRSLSLCNDGLTTMCWCHISLFSVGFIINELNTIHLAGNFASIVLGFWYVQSRHNIDRMFCAPDMIKSQGLQMTVIPLGSINPSLNAYSSFQCIFMPDVLQWEFFWVTSNGLSNTYQTNNRFRLRLRNTLG